jgi:hypothetical protein
MVGWGACPHAGEEKFFIITTVTLLTLVFRASFFSGIRWLGIVRGRIMITIIGFVIICFCFLSVIIISFLRGVVVVSSS